MGLSGYAVDAIVREHTYRPIRRRVLFIARQTVTISASELASRLRKHGNAVDDMTILIDS